MNETKLLLNTYYEPLHNRLVEHRDLLSEKIEKLLEAEFSNSNFGNVDQKKFEAYRDACLAFVDERIEMYNPIGIQYIFDHGRAKEAFELELQLNWYDSRAEFEALVEAARIKVEAEATEGKLQELAGELIREMGAFPDKSIIAAYEAKPKLQALPDYIVARTIEEIIG